MNMQGLRDNIEAWRESVAEGWHRLRQRAAGAMTRFRPGAASSLPPSAQVDDQGWSTAGGWAVLGGDVFEDERRVVVRLEAPGMDREDLEIEVFDDRLEVRGEKRFEREDTDGQWRVLQCAYGSFERSVPLPAAVAGDGARASYRNGVLKVELPKRQPGRSRATRIPVR